MKNLHKSDSYEVMCDNTCVAFPPVQISRLGVFWFWVRRKLGLVDGWELFAWEANRAVLREKEQGFQGWGRLTKREDGLYDFTADGKD